jgi:hypothetical protein
MTRQLFNAKLFFRPCRWVKRIDPDLAVPHHVEFVMRESQLGDQLTKNENPSSFNNCTKIFLTKNGHFLAVLRIRILDPVPFCPLDQRSGTQNGQKIRIRIRDEQPRSYFRELRTIFWVKMLKFFNAEPGWKKFGSCINIPDPQHCFLAPKLLSFYTVTTTMFNIA